MSLISTSENSPQKQMNSLIFSIEGNIGVGKSTLLKILSENMIEDIEYLPENVASWQNVGGQNINLLEMMYKDPVRYGFIFQQYALLTRMTEVNNFRQQSKSQLCFMERSIFSNKEVFMKNYEINNLQTEAEVLVYNSWYDRIIKKCDSQIDGIIYLQADSQVCLERCQKRQRSEENCIDINYLKQIEERHQDWLSNVESYNGVPVLVIDSNLDYINDQENVNKVVNQVQNFIALNFNTK